MIEEVGISTCNDFSTLLDGWVRELSDGNGVVCKDAVRSVT